MDTAIESAVARLEPGTQVRIEIDGGKVFEGALRADEGDGFVSLLNEAGGNTDVARNPIVDVVKLVELPGPE